MAETVLSKPVLNCFSAFSSGDQRKNDNSPCPGQPMSQYHTTGENDLGGCALAISYKSNAKDVKPEDLAVFSVNQKCVWEHWTPFDVSSPPSYQKLSSLGFPTTVNIVIR